MPRSAKTSDKYPSFYMDVAEHLYKGQSLELTFNSVGEATSWRYRFYDFRRALARENHEFATVAGGALLRVQPLPTGQGLMIIEDMTIKEAELEAQVRAQIGGHTTVDDLARRARERFLKDPEVTVEREETPLAPLAPEPEDPEDTITRLFPTLKPLVPNKD